MAVAVRGFWAAWAALGFWAVNLPALVRLTWFPLALLSLAGYGWSYWNSAVDLAQVEARRAGLEADAVYLPSHLSFDGVVLWAVLQLLALSAAAVAVHRLVVAGERRPGEFFAFSFGKAETAYFAMGAVAYGLIAALVAGQFAAQLTMPPLDDYLLTSTMKPYAELGPFVLGMFIWPGELSILDMPPVNYALWCALVIATGAVIIRLSAWPATVAARQSFAIGDALALSRGRTHVVVAFFGALALAAAVVLGVLALGGLSGLALAGPDQMGLFLQGLTAGGEAAATQDVEIQSILNARSLAFYQEIARFLAGLIGVTLGATLISHLYLALAGDARR